MADAARVTELITKIAGDPALRERLAASDDASRPGILAEIGFGDVTPADVAASAGHFMAPAVEAIDDSELEAVAGGGDTITTVTTTTTVTAAASAAVAT